MRKIILIVIILAILLTGCSIVKESAIETIKELKSSPSSSETVSPTPTVDLSVTFEEIYKAYEENELRADDTYRHNRYQITAEINGMNTGGLKNITGGATLTMLKIIGNKRLFFIAEFEGEQEEVLKTINVGDTITFEGECLGAGDWIDCELVE